jgi:predicted ATPase
MTKLGKKLGKLSLAILENFVSKALGEKFVDELRQPTDRELAIESALEKSEIRFAKEFQDKVFAEKMFTQVKDENLGLLVDAIEKFYDHLTDLDLKNALSQIVTESFRDADAELTTSAVDLYLGILTEEFMVADETFREKFRGLADIRSLEILRRVEFLLSQGGIPKTQNTVLRFLHQLPQPPADFIGRENLIEDLLKEFENHKGAIISGLTGMGGIGKTALGLVVGHRIAEKYPDAQIFLDLKGTTEPLGAMEIARHVILSFEPTADPRELDDANIFTAYQSVLHEKKALLFFDNARSAEQIAPLRPPDSCALLITSRWTFSVPGLQVRRVDVMTEDDAKTFLLELCPRIDGKAAHLADACAYLPLALRIAGSFLQVNNDWSVEAYLSELNDRKKRLGTLKESRAEADLHSEPDLLATFELSYGGLSEENRKHWRKLGIFPASFDIGVAQAVWELEENDTRKILNFLRRYSLLEYDETASRYSLHDLLADYALSQMNEQAEQEVRLKHASHYLNIMSLADALYLKGGQNILQGLRLFDLEWEHIRAAHL